MFNFFKRFIRNKAEDPVHNCPLYRDTENGSCVHVDGPLCNFPYCSLLSDARATDNFVEIGCIRSLRNGYAVNLTKPAEDQMQIIPKGRVVRIFVSVEDLKK